jgi:hypothetical protein
VPAEAGGWEAAAGPAAAGADGAGEGPGAATGWAGAGAGLAAWPGAGATAAGVAVLEDVVAHAFARSPIAIETLKTAAVLRALEQSIESAVMTKLLSGVDGANVLS